jgi:DNA-binding transcriptional regulator GbsR (MarR family)
MDIESVYKKVKEESAQLVGREKELQRRIEEVKRMAEQNRERRNNIKRLEKELRDLISATDLK